MGYKRARALRKELTPAEKKLWAYLRGNKLKGVSFRRHKVLAFAQGHSIGKYIVDFCSIKEKLVIELDGSEHLEQEEYDCERSAFLESKGYRVVRFWNKQVMTDINGVIYTIELALISNSAEIGNGRVS